MRRVVVAAVFRQAVLVLYDLRHGVRAQDPDLRSLSEVMVLGIHPENRHRAQLSLSKLIGNTNRRQRFVDGIEGSGKKTNLLAGDHGNAIRLLQVSYVIKGSLCASEGSILTIEDFRHLRARIGSERAAGQGLHTLECWGARVKSQNLRRKIKVVKIQLRLMRNLAKGNDGAGHTVPKSIPKNICHELHEIP